MAGAAGRVLRPSDSSRATARGRERRDCLIHRRPAAAAGQAYGGPIPGAGTRASKVPRRGGLFSVAPVENPPRFPCAVADEDVRRDRVCPPPSEGAVQYKPEKYCGGENTV